MEYRILGSDGPRVSALGLGCMGTSDFYSVTPESEAESITVLHRAIDDLGVTLIDTADMYGRGENEKLVGRADIELGADVPARIEAAVPHGAAAGERYAPDSARRGARSDKARAEQR